MKNLLSWMVIVAAASAVAAASLIAMRVETEAVEGGADGTVMRIIVQIAPEDRGRSGSAVWMNGELTRRGEKVHRFDGRAEVDAQGVALLQRTWAPGSYELRVDIESLRGGATGFWKGRIEVPALAAPAAPEAAPEPAAAAAATPAAPAVHEAPAPAEMEEVSTTAPPAPSPSPAAPTPQPTIASTPAPPARSRPPVDGTASPSLTVIVTDAQNKPVMGLDRHRFKLQVDRQPRAITTFAGPDSPLLLVVAVDISSSMGPELAGVRRALARLSERVLGSDGRLQVITCDAQPRTVIHKSSGDRDLTAALMQAGEAVEGDLAALVSAALDAASALEGRRVAVVLSDGGDSASRSDWRAVQQAASAAGVPLLSVGLDLGELRMRTSDRLRKASEASGGKHYLLSNVEVLELTLDHFGELINACYGLGIGEIGNGEQRVIVNAGEGLQVKHSAALRLQ